MAGDIKVEDVAADTNVAFKDCAPFARCVTHINDEHVETSENLDITILLNILIIMQTLLVVYISLKEISL